MRIPHWLGTQSHIDWGGEPNKGCGKVLKHFPSIPVLKLPQKGTPTLVGEKNETATLYKGVERCGKLFLPNVF